MREIPLTQGYVALVDDADFEAVNAFKWHVVKKGSRRCVARRQHKSEGFQGIQYLAQFLLPGNIAVDHEDGNGLNNQKYNLRPCTYAQNLRAFRTKSKGKSSSFRGVSWSKARGKWVAKIEFLGKTIYLGRFSCEKAAAGAYDLAATKYFGEFASPNFK